MKPSLHELISKAIFNYTSIELIYPISESLCDELAEQIIKIVRDYHLVEPKGEYDALWQEKENK